MTKSKRGKKVPHLGGLRRLLKSGARGLNEDERALLIALAALEADRLDEDERAALEKVKARMKDYDPEEVTQAVKHMVTAQPREGSRLEWPELKRDKPRRRTSKR